MYNKIKGFIMGVVVTALLSSLVFAEGVKQTIQVEFNRIKVEVNGVKVGADNILYNGTTFVPLRVVSEMLGKEVKYNKETNTASINDAKNELQKESDGKVKSYAKEILDKEKDPNNAIIEICDVIYSKLDDENVTALTEAEKTLYYVYELEGEVNNGGLSQYFFNSSGENAQDAVIALKNIGAVYTASLLEQAISVCKDPTTGDINNDIDLTDDQEEELNALDKKLYEYTDNLLEMEVQFVQKNIDKFK